MDKAITIMGIVTAVIIVIVIIYLALSVAGVFKFGGKKELRVTADRVTDTDRV